MYFSSHTFISYFKNLHVLSLIITCWSLSSAGSWIWGRIIPNRNWLEFVSIVNWLISFIALMVSRPITRWSWLAFQMGWLVFHITWLNFWMSFMVSYVGWHGSGITWLISVGVWMIFFTSLSRIGGVQGTFLGLVPWYNSLGLLLTFAPLTKVSELHHATHDLT